MQARGYSYRIASVTSLSGFLFGFDIAIINGAIVFLRRQFQWTEIETEVAAGRQLAGLGEQSWRWMFAVASIPSLLFFVALFSVPESPRWLVKEGRKHEAAQVLARLGEPPSQLREIERAIAQESGSIRQLFEKGLRRPLLIGITLP